MPETPLPKFDPVRSLGTNLGIMQMSKILHATKSSSRPIRFRMTRALAQAFCAVDGASQLFSFCFENKGRSSSGVREWVSPYRTRISTKDARSEDQKPHGKGMACSEAKAEKALARRGQNNGCSEDYHGNRVQLSCNVCNMMQTSGQL